MTDETATQSAAPDAVIRRATAADVAGIVAMIADDQLGATRESVDDLTPYLKAFEAIDSDPNQVLVVAERNDELIGTLQLTIIPGLSRRGFVARSGRSRPGRRLRPRFRPRYDADGVGGPGVPQPRLHAWSSSPRTRPAPTPTASTTASGSPTPTRASNSSSADPLRRR